MNRVLYYFHHCEPTTPVSTTMTYEDEEQQQHRPANTRCNTQMNHNNKLTRFGVVTMVWVLVIEKMWVGLEATVLSSAIRPSSVISKIVLLGKTAPATTVRVLLQLLLSRFPSFPKIYPLYGRKKIVMTTT